MLEELNWKSTGKFFAFITWRNFTTIYKFSFFLFIQKKNNKLCDHSVFSISRNKKKTEWCFGIFPQYHHHRAKIIGLIKRISNFFFVVGSFLRYVCCVFESVCVSRDEENRATKWEIPQSYNVQRESIVSIAS